jgi:antibiotic biosynthesis monooxygenase (ABM) superfamily enzyme
MAQRVESREAPDARRQGEPPPGAAPPRYKLALLTWAGAYAVITLILAVLGPAMAPWPLPLRTLLLSVLMVAAMTWLVIPSLTRLFRGWLTPASPRSARRPRGAVWAADRTGGPGPWPGEDRHRPV